MRTSATAAKVFLGAGLAGIMATASAVEPAATLSRINDNAYAAVSQGAHYVKGHEGMVLMEGDRIMVMEGGSAVISFADGCQYTLTDMEVLTIGSASTCASISGGAYKVDPYSGVSKAPGIYQEAALEPPTPPPPMAAEEREDYGIVPWVIGGLVVAGAAVAIANNNDDDNNGVQGVQQVQVSP